MKSPAYPTHFLACVEGQHNDCQHVDAEGNVVWICQCDCHPRELAAPHNNYALFPTPPESVQLILRHSGLKNNGKPMGLRQCDDCGDWRGLCLDYDEPLEWHNGLHQVFCRCEVAIRC